MNNHNTHSSNPISPVPLVSVGIPTYNRPNGLKILLESIINQSYKNLEIIVSDNCSPGTETQAIMSEFLARDSRIRFFRQPKNQGPIFNFEFVLGKATGGFFIWAADDDAWKDTYIENCLNEFLKNRSLVLCYSEAVKKNNQDAQELLLSSDITTVGLKKIDGIKKVINNQYRNIEFYGLIKTRIARQYHFKNFFGEDQIFVLFLAFHGKIEKTKPGLFINGLGSIGTSSEKTVRSQGLHTVNVYFGYIFLIINTISMVFSYDFDLRWVEKGKIVFYVIRKSLTWRYLKAIGFGIKMLLTDTLNVI